MVRTSMWKIADVVASKFYSSDETEKEHCIGILAESSKNAERITKEPVLNWGWNVMGGNSDVKDVLDNTTSVRRSKRR